MAALAAVAPAAAKGQPEETTADATQPMTLIVSLSQQRVDVYRGMTLITTSRVSTGKPGHRTKAGVFSILEKQRHHYSNLYGGAPMPWMNRITWSGTALHAGVVPGYPASHGCIRLPYSFAPKLFGMTTVGEHVIVANGRPEPKLVEHATLFQPAPPPAPPVLAKDHEEHLQRRSSNEAAPPHGSLLPVVFAKAETSRLGGTAPDAPVKPLELHGFAMNASGQATAGDPPARASVAVAMIEDTRVHAIDPAAGPTGGSMAGDTGNATHAAMPAKAQNEEDIAAATPEETKPVDRLSPPAGEAPVAAANEPDAPADAAIAKTAAVAPAEEQPEPQAGPILTVSATALPQPVTEPVSGEIAVLGPPPLPPVKPSVIAAKVVAGAATAAVEAAEPMSTEPLRVLVTRRTKRDRLIDAQYMLSSMGYLDAQDFDGTFGRQTIQAIKAFQKANEMPETGAFTDDVAKKIYEVAGKEEPPEGHLFVRQKFTSLFDAPVTLRNPDEPLGTHLYTVMAFKPGDTKAQWMAFNLSSDDDATAVLDRIEIPDDLRQKISERLTPGSSLIVADTAINSATLSKGSDFLVWDTSESAKVQRASVSPTPQKKRTTTRRRATTYSSNSPSRRSQRRPNWPFF